MLKNLKSLKLSNKLLLNDHRRFQSHKSDMYALHFYIPQTDICNFSNKMPVSDGCN